MYPQAVGFNPGSSLLSGLSKKPGDAGAFAKGQAMANAASLNMDRQQQNQEMGVRQMQADSQMRQQQNQNQTQKATNQVAERVAGGALDSRKKVFDTSMNFDYAGLRKRQNMAIQQALLNNFARDM
jgi:hypothetical protein